VPALAQPVKKTGAEPSQSSVSTNGKKKDGSGSAAAKAKWNLTSKKIDKHNTSIQK
jgi:hypothetical protein